MGFLLLGSYHSMWSCLGGKIWIASHFVINYSIVSFNCMHSFVLRQLHMWIQKYWNSSTLGHSRIGFGVSTCYYKKSTLMHSCEIHSLNAYRGVQSLYLDGIVPFPFSIGFGFCLVSSTPLLLASSFSNTPS